MKHFTTEIRHISSIRSYPSRLAEVKKHHGRATKYQQTDFMDFGCFALMSLVEIVCFRSNFFIPRILLDIFNGESLEKLGEKW